MLVLLSSNAETRFKRNILDVLCYPRGQLTSFRYQSKYVAPTTGALLTETTRFRKRAPIGKEALIIYVQRPTTATDDFSYVPIRYGVVRAYRWISDVIFVDVELGAFASVGSWTNSQALEHRFRGSMSTRSGAINPTTFEGYFFDEVPDVGWRLRESERPDGEHWKTVVCKLAELPSMDNCLFYQIRGVFTPVSPSRFNGYKSSVLINRMRKRGGLFFSLPMSTSFELRFLFFRPPSSKPKTITAVVNVKPDESGFSIVPIGTLKLESRYDELIVPLVTKRVFDNVLAPISVSISSEHTPPILASEPLIYCAVKVPRGLVIVIGGALLLAPLLLAMSKKDWACAGLLLPRLTDAFDISASQCKPPDELVGIGKALGAMIASVAGWLAFRRLPLGK